MKQVSLSAKPASGSSPSSRRRKYLVWLFLALPACLLPLTGKPLPELLHPTGEFSARLLVVALCVTPLIKLSGRASWAQWLLNHRRAIGVAAFGYAGLHTVLYLVERASLAKIISELPEPAIWVGWLALVLMLMPALLSNDWSVKTFRKQWKPLQRLAYPCGLATVLHWGFLHGGWIPALVHASPVFVLNVAAILKQKLARKRRAEAALAAELDRPMEERVQCKGRVPGEIVPVVDLSKCEGVGACVEVCPFDVFSIETIADDAFEQLPFKAKVKQRVHGMKIAATPRADQCLNCGVCVAACPEDAIKLARLPLSEASKS